MKIASSNEWSTLKSVVVGTANFANWPKTDPVFISQETAWTNTPLPAGAVPQWIVDETNEDLEKLVAVLKQFGAEVHRPNDIDFVGWDGMYNYCPRDRLLIGGSTVIDCAMMYPSRDIEILAYNDILSGQSVIQMPRDQGMVLDAANVCRINDKWIFLESKSGNQKAAAWLQQQFPNIAIEVVNFYSGVHIDSTIAVLREGFAVVNGSRVNLENLPQTLKGWDVVFMQDMIEQGFHDYPYASKWIGMNMLSLDSQTVVVDRNQITLIAALEKNKFTVIPLELRHSRTLGGGFHCVTLDLHRE